MNWGPSGHHLGGDVRPTTFEVACAEIQSHLEDPGPSGTRPLSPSLVLDTKGFYPKLKGLASQVWDRELCHQKSVRCMAF